MYIFCICIHIMCINGFYQYIIYNLCLSQPPNIGCSSRVKLQNHRWKIAIASHQAQVSPYLSYPAINWLRKCCQDTLHHIVPSALQNASLLPPHLHFHCLTWIQGFKTCQDANHPVWEWQKECYVWALQCKTPRSLCAHVVSRLSSGLIIVSLKVYQWLERQAWLPKTNQSN